MEYVVKPKRVRLPLSQGQFIDVKRRLNTGEQQDMFAAMAPVHTPGEKLTANSKAVMTAKVLAYLVGWSLTDDGDPLPMTPEMSDAERLAVIRSLDPDTFAEIRDAIDAHEQSVDAEVLARKNGQGTVSASSQISPLPESLVGATSGSAN
jgi:hypothetical protein